MLIVNHQVISVEYFSLFGFFALVPRPPDGDVGLERQQTQFRSKGDDSAFNPEPLRTDQGLSLRKGVFRRRLRYGTEYYPTRPSDTQQSGGGITEFKD